MRTEKVSTGQKATDLRQIAPPNSNRLSQIKSRVHQARKSAADKDNVGEESSACPSHQNKTKEFYNSPL